MENYSNGCGLEGCGQSRRGLEEARPRGDVVKGGMAYLIDGVEITEMTSK